MSSNSSDLAVSVRGLSKSYSIAHQAVKHSTLAETLLSRARNPFRREERETFAALREVSFEVKKGEVVGIIGRNGAGKSTLLKVLSRITQPTAGEIDLYGRVGSLLEVGTGFHPELTGRENIYLNGAILGMSRAEIRQQFDAIVDFAGVEKFLDTPVKRYSSGMYVRLAFAVAAHLESEILVIDEVLAVGDTEFQRKCLGKMKAVAAGGRTVLFVSHNMQSVTALCTKALLLDQGTVAYLGDVTEAALRYARAGSKPGKGTKAPDPSRRRGTGEFRLASVAPANDFFSCAEEKTIRATIERRQPWRGRIDLIFILRDERDIAIAQLDSRLLALEIDAPERLEVELTIRTPWLRPGLYRIDAHVCGSTAMDEFPDACSFEVIADFPYADASSPYALEHGIVLADFSIDVRETGQPALLADVTSTPAPAYARASA
jgi:lipopolysaccharide transport system ATP-binding protein